MHFCGLQEAYRLLTSLLVLLIVGMLAGYGRSTKRLCLSYGPAWCARGLLVAVHFAFGLGSRSSYPLSTVFDLKCGLAVVRQAIVRSFLFASRGREVALLRLSPAASAWWVARVVNGAQVAADLSLPAWNTSYIVGSVSAQSHGQWRGRTGYLTLVGPLVDGGSGVRFARWCRAVLRVCANRRAIAALHVVWLFSQLDVCISRRQPHESAAPWDWGGFLPRRVAQGPRSGPTSAATWDTRMSPISDQVLLFGSRMTASSL